MAKETEELKVGLQTLELPVTDPESGEVYNMFFVGLAQMDYKAFTRIFKSGEYRFDDVFKDVFEISAPQDFLEAAGNEKMQEFIDAIGEAIDSVARNL